MRGTLFKGPGAGVTMQALAIIEGSVELDVFRLRDFPQVLNIDVMQSPPFGCNSAKHRVIGVAGITSMIPGNAVVLKMRRRYIAAIIYVKTLAVILHDMA